MNSHSHEKPDSLEKPYSLEEPETLEQTVSGAWSPRRKTKAFERGDGCWLQTREGRRYLDLTAAYGTAPLGHAHPRLAEAIAQQAQTLIACPQNLFSLERSRLLERLSMHLPPGLAHIFLCNSGAEAIEGALKFARAATGRTGVVALKGSFHGRTVGALTATWNPKTRTPFEPLLDNVTFVQARKLDVALAELEAAIDDQTSCFVAEVIQGESGVFPIADEILVRAQELCHQRGALLLIDEIQTGIGRTGHWFAHQPLGLEPDLMALAKGLGGGFPIGAVCFSAAISESLFPGAHGSTFGGNPLACAAARTTLETIERDDLIGTVRARGEQLQSLLQERVLPLDKVREIRGRGLMLGVELREKAGRTLARLTNEFSVLALPAGGTVVRFLPPFIIDDQQIETAVDSLVKALA